MITMEKQDELFAEKCRAALEKHYGFEIPMPEEITKGSREKKPLMASWKRILAERKEVISQKIKKSGIMEIIQMRWLTIKCDYLQWTVAMYISLFSYLGMISLFFFLI